MITIFMTLLIGLAGGLAVGASVVAFFTVLGVIAHIVEWSKKKEYILVYQFSIVFGALLSCLLYFSNFTLKYMEFLTIPLGFLMGIFIGMIVAALTETLDIISIAVNKLSIAKWIYLIVIVIILGKIIGSLLFFLVPGFIDI